MEKCGAQWQALASVRAVPTTVHPAAAHLALATGRTPHALGLRLVVESTGRNLDPALVPAGNGYASSIVSLFGGFADVLLSCGCSLRVAWRCGVWITLPMPSPRLLARLLRFCWPLRWCRRWGPLGTNSTILHALLWDMSRLPTVLGATPPLHSCSSSASFTLCALLR